MKECTLPWVVIGDLNELLSADEKQKGGSILRKRLYLRHFMETSGGDRLGICWQEFHLEEQLGRSSLYQRRLDRAIANKDWMELLLLASVKHLRTEESDHCPILLQLEMKENNANKLFRFLQA